VRRMKGMTLTDAALIGILVVLIYAAINGWG
jgi:hypothetical protein